MAANTTPIYSAAPSVQIGGGGGGGGGVTGGAGGQGGDGLMIFLAY